MMRIDLSEKGTGKPQQDFTKRRDGDFAPTASWLPAFLLFAAMCLSACATVDRIPDRAVGASAGDDALAHGLDLIVDKAVTDGFGGQVAIMRDGALVYSRAGGFADNDGEIPVRENTLYHVASLTKYFTAALTLKAVEDGLLKLSDPASAAFKGTPLASREFSIDDLLSHRSGLRSTYAAESETSADRALAAIAEANAANARDGDFHYANDGYDLLAILIERLYGKPYETAFREKLAAPAGLENFGFWDEAALNDPDIRGQPLKSVGANLSRRNYGMIGSAGLLITANELVRWQDALTRERVLTGDGLRQLYSPRLRLSIGNALYGSFLIASPRLGTAISARGSEDWGDNAYLNDYRDCGFIVAITTSRGPAEESGKPLFRDSLISAIEEKLEPRCRALE